MNHDGFRKILKKHDKVTQVPLMSSLMPEVDRSMPSVQEEQLQVVPFPVLSMCNPKIYISSLCTAHAHTSLARHS
jgi:SPX domain protein involved in polyphosphate accumulation